MNEPMLYKDAPDPKKSETCIVIGCQEPTSPLNDFLCHEHRFFENTATCSRLNCSKVYVKAHDGKRCTELGCAGIIVAEMEGKAA